LNHNQSTRETLPLLYKAFLKVQKIPDFIPAIVMALREQLAQELKRRMF
jgi:hypothetical protein